MGTLQESGSRIGSFQRGLSGNVRSSPVAPPALALGKQGGKADCEGSDLVPDDDRDIIASTCRRHVGRLQDHEDILDAKDFIHV